MLTFQILLLILSIFLLWFGADWLVAAASRVAKRLGISEMIIGLTVVAAGTSAPEIAVSVGASLRGEPEIALANIIGSNIFNLGLILGLVVLVSSVITSRAMVFRDGIMLMGSSLLLLLFVSDGTLSRFEGLFLITCLAGYILFLIKQRVPMAEELPEGEYKWTDWGQLAIGLAMVLGGGQFLVGSATFIATSFGLSEWLIGLTIVAIGTSAPELVTSLTAILRGNHGISIGNLIGSDLFNILGAVGVAAIARPLVISTTHVMPSLILMAGMAVIITYMMRSDWRLSRTEGGLLFGMGLARWAMNLFLF